MALRIPYSLTATHTAVDLGSTDDLFVARDVTLGSTAGNAVLIGNGVGQQVVVHGTVVGKFIGVKSDLTTNATVTVGEEGRIAGFSSAGVSLIGNGTDNLLRVVNAGVVELLQGDTGAAVALGGFKSQMAVVNEGLIRSTAQGISTNGSPIMGTVTNSGVIEADGFAINLSGASLAEVTNTGRISGDVALGFGNDLYEGSQGELDGALWGGMGRDRLYAGTGVQEIHGEAGGDTLMGGAGGDKLDGGADADTASYASATAGVKASLANASGNTGDAKGDTYISIERLVGSQFADTLVGNGGVNQLNGGAGADTLTGGAGADVFVFNAKPSGSATADRITDFQTDLDHIRLDDAKFMGLTLGDLAGEAFWASASGAAHDGTDRVIYETDTGWLRWDADGNGAGAAMAFARLAAGLNLGADDFFVS